MRDELMNDPEALRKFLAESAEMEELREQTDLIIEKDFLGEHVVGKQFSDAGLPGDLGYCIGRCYTQNKARFAVVGHWDGSRRGFCQACAMELADLGMRQAANRRRRARTDKRNNAKMWMPKSRRRRA